MSEAGTATLHRVQRLRVTLRGATTAAQGLAWRHALEGGGDDPWSRGLNHALDQVAGAHGLGADTWHVPQLSVRLRLASTEADALLAELGEALPQAVAQALEEALVAKPPRHHGVDDWHQATLWAYLREGRVPWHADDRDPSRVLQALRSTAARWWQRAHQDPAARVLPDPDARSRDPRSIRHAVSARLATLLDDSSFAQLTSQVKRTEAARDAAADAGADAPAEASGASHRRAARFTPGAPSQDDPPADLDERGRWIWRWWLAAPSTQDATSSPTTAPAGAAPQPPAHPPPPAAATHPATGLLPDATPPAPTASSALAPRATAEPSASAEAQARWLAHDAGLVLLHPYLPTLLAAIGCTCPVDADWPAPSLARAATMLGWLATGQDEVHEFQLTAARVLLGLHPAAPLELQRDSARVDAVMREEGLALLEAVIGHWGALGRTSPTTLRMNFLARDGLLSREPNGPWQLHLADEPYDLLLRRLPWGIGLVRLPWMRDALQVHWGGA